MEGDVVDVLFKTILPATNATPHLALRCKAPRRVSESG